MNLWLQDVKLETVGVQPVIMGKYDSINRRCDDMREVTHTGAYWEYVDTGEPLHRASHMLVNRSTRRMYVRVAGAEKNIQNNFW